MHLERLKWPEVHALGDRVFLVPLGSLEQHGRHLPLETDATIITEIARRIESAQPDQVVVTPTLWLGHSPHHRRFACLSLDVRPYMEMIAGVCRSLVEMGARRILLLNGHGGNDIPAKAAMRELKSEFEARKDLYIAYATYWQLASAAFQNIRSSPKGGMNHACEMETSVMLAVAPEQVEMPRAEPGGPFQETGLRASDMLAARPYYIVNDFDELSASGVIGLPQYADAAKGNRFLDAPVDAVLAFLREFRTWRYQTERPERPA